ncbi:hypothetical protein LPW26_24085 [Rhodopseudomonas sp. HC1]|nr:hypothetical protein [Rhodopseudomonas infernalis]MCG6207739.1 hypothetical protein [Rhodopseudomonas infernalis]
MASDIRRFVMLSVAMVLFLAAAQASAGLSWRGSEPARIATIGIVQ